MEKLPAQMTVVGISKPGGPEVLLPETRAVPVPGPGEILIKGGSSGIGTMAIQLAKAFGSKVIVTVGSKDKAEACLKLGAARAINYKTEDFVAEVKTATDGAGANVILDMVGGDYIDRNYDAAATDGRVVQIAFLSGTPKATVN